MARGLVTAVFVAVLLQFVLGGALGQFADGVMRLERNMRVIEISLLTLLVALMLFYGVHLGRNLFGLLFGYGLLLTSNMLMLILHTALGPSAQSWLNPLREILEMATVVIWLAMLWRIEPVPVPVPSTGLEEDYAELTERVGRAIAVARQQIARIFAA
jgi:hypothetical protein